MSERRRRLAEKELGGLSRFTRSVLEHVPEIPYGETRSYRRLAEQLGRPRSARAAGNALARNPLPIIIPCHRLVRRDAQSALSRSVPDGKRDCSASKKDSQKQKLHTDDPLRAKSSSSVR